MNGLRIPGWVEELALGQGEKRTAAQPTTRPPPASPLPHTPARDRQAAAESASVPSRWRRSSEAPGPRRPVRRRGRRSRSPSSFRRGGPAGPAPRTPVRPGRVSARSPGAPGRSPPQRAPWRSPGPGPAAGRQRPNLPRGAATPRAREDPRVVRPRARARRFTCT